MQIKIKASSHVVTRDGYDLGLARRIYHRRSDIDPELKLYAAYLQTRSLESGEDYYIPTDFIVGERADGAVLLNVDTETVEHETWTRMPDFVARGDGDKEELV